MTLAACDVADREQLETLMASIPAERPLRAVVHAAGVLDDGVIDSMNAERIDRVLAPKAHGALNLHELTRDMDLSAFVLFSSIAGTLGGGGQASYAAANAFLDALAADRRAQGLPATSVAWGAWAGEGMVAQTHARASRHGCAGMGSGRWPPEEKRSRRWKGRCSERRRQWRSPISAGRSSRRYSPLAGPSPLIEDLAEVAGCRGGHREWAVATSGAVSELRGRLADMPAEKRGQVLLEVVRTEVARVLGHPSAAAVDADRAFKALGFDSLTALELRNRLSDETGLRLPATLIFDYPTPAVLAEHLLGRAGGRGGIGRGARRVRACRGSRETERRSTHASGRSEPIAIVGMSCRYPGGVRSPEGLWELVAAGGDGIGEFPTDRGWDLEWLYHPDADHAVTAACAKADSCMTPRSSTRGSSGSRRVRRWRWTPSSGFCWKQAGRRWWMGGSTRARCRAARPGCSWYPWVRTTRAAAGVRRSAGRTGYQATGSLPSVVSGRVAYTLGLEGPALTVDTACSSSLVALHLACQSLRGGECSLALAGGVSVLSTPGMFVELSRQRGLAPDGRCKSFAEAADGTGWGEGVGVLLLARLSDALQDGRPVLAVVRGSAVNQDGASNGLTAPNGPSQQRVIRRALASAGLPAEAVDAVEAHGTGTRLGDPIEAQALLATYGRERPPGRPLWLGSVKSNIGHAQAAAGVAGVIKVVMAMRHGTLPRTLHVDEPSTQVDWTQGAVSLLRDEVPWQGNGRPRRAGVSSFGVSGTNAHVILEEPPGVGEAPAVEEPQAVGEVLTGEGLPGGEGPSGEEIYRAAGSANGSTPGGDTLAAVLDVGDAVPWVVSGRGERAVRGQAARLLKHVTERPALLPADVGLSLTGRSAFAHRGGGRGGQAGSGWWRGLGARWPTERATRRAWSRAWPAAPGPCSWSPARAVSGRAWQLS